MAMVAQAAFLVKCVTSFEILGNIFGAKGEFAAAKILQMDKLINYNPLNFFNFELRSFHRIS